MLDKFQKAFAKVSSWMKGIVSPEGRPTKADFQTAIDQIANQEHEVRSSYITKVRYDPETRKMAVTYSGKKTCIYSDISLEMYADFWLAPSKGRWARENLFNRSYQ